MRKISAILSLTALLLCGCTVSELTSGRFDSPVFTASIEEMPSTKTYVDGNLKLLWDADDRLSIFTTTLNEEYSFDGATGDNSGTFTKVSSSQFGTGNSISTIYAVYPYSSSNKLTNDEKITLTMPYVQSYAEGSFCPGANTMVAVTSGPSDYFLPFKNLCGFLVVKLYGEGSVKSISIKGNNGEKLAGPATVTASHSSAPTLAFGDDATETITIDCGAGVTLGSDASHATEFWFCIPPVTFSKGFTITATNTEEWSMVKSTGSSRTITRNIKTSMTALQGVFDTRIGNIEFEDANFKAYCVENFDKDGDGEISYEEAESVTEINCRDKNISSLRGVEMFTSLTKLICDNNKLEELDISKNIKLTELQCWDNLLANLDVSNNTDLTNLGCNGNKLTELDFSQNPKLYDVNCNGNQLTRLHVSGASALTFLSCAVNQLTSIDVRYNASLYYLHCFDNQLSDLDVSKNTALTSLDCSPMSTLETLYIAQGQSISGVTENRNSGDIPDATKISVVGVPEYVDLGLSVKWATFNIGAAVPWEPGDFYAWGETGRFFSEERTGYKWSNETGMTKYSYNSMYSQGNENRYTDYYNILHAEDDAATVNWGSQWRMPTADEQQELLNECTWTWISMNGKNGYLVTGPSKKSIFLPMTGWSGDLNGSSYYWSSSLCENYYANVANNIAFNEYTDYHMDSWYRFYGSVIRPVFSARVDVQSVTLDITSVEIEQGALLKLEATVKPDNAVCTRALWLSNNTSVATVSSDGVITAIAPGCTTITAYCDGKSANCEVIVSEAN